MTFGGVTYRVIIVCILVTNSKKGGEYKMKMDKTFDAFLVILWSKYRVSLFAPVAVKREITRHLTFET